MVLIPAAMAANVCPLTHYPKLFQRCLMTVLQIDLWKCYIAYVRETKAALPGFRYLQPMDIYALILTHIENGLLCMTLYECICQCVYNLVLGACIAIATGCMDVS